MTGETGPGGFTCNIPEAAGVVLVDDHPGTGPGGSDVVGAMSLDLGDDRAFESDPNKRRLQAAETRKLEVEFGQAYKAHLPADFAIEVTFDSGELLEFP